MAMLCPGTGTQVGAIQQQHHITLLVTFIGKWNATVFYLRCTNRTQYFHKVTSKTTMLLDHMCVPI
jgi:hypothetical protein